MNFQMRYYQHNNSTDLQQWNFIITKGMPLEKDALPVSVING